MWLAHPVRAIKGLPKLAQNWSVSFIGLHYMYIIGLTIIGSICLYPLDNISYQDALFLAAAACTQAGLNTVDLKELRLYQQIVLYILPMLTTPIFIHSFVVFLRLYWFEKYFDGIKQSSKLQSRLRRTATMAKAQGADSIDAIEQGHGNSSGNTEKEDTQNQQQQPSSSSSGYHSPSPSPSPGFDDTEEKDNQDPPQPTDIRFGDLPQPHRQNTIAPKDMYTSISMMQRNRRMSNDDDSPALVIKGPREMDEEHERQEAALRAGTSASSSIANGNSNGISQKPSIQTLTSETSNTANNLTRSQSHTITSGTAEENGVKFGKRAHTIEGDISNTVDNTGIDGLPNSSGMGRKKRRLARTMTFEQFLSNAKNKLHRDDSFDINKHKLQRTMTANYLSWEPTVGRNSQFVDLTPEQKEELGGVEYRALKLLAKILVGYYVGFHIMAVVLILPWTLRSSPYYVDYIRSNGISPTWWAFFTCESGFNDVGHILTPDSMAHFNQNAYVQIVISFFMVIGNTGFPCLLRLIIWIMFKFSKESGRSHESLAFLLDHPRRCFTLLFPTSATWWLFFVLVALNGVDLIFYIVLDINNAAVEGIPVGYRILNGLFQAFATRTTGYSVVSISELHAGIQVSYMVMMYISVLPIAISIRRTNVYEEQSLGVYDSSVVIDEQSSASYVGNHLRRQLSFDLWYIALGLFIITIAEGGKVDNDTGNFVSFDIFAIMFEVVSAYGTVGLSMGYPDTNTSFSAQFSTVSKLIIIAMVIRGRHRGLPYALDRAVMKPSERLQRQDTITDQRAKTAKLIRENTLQQDDNPINDTNADQATAVSSGVFVNNDTNLKPRSSIGSGISKLRRLSMAGLAPGPPKYRAATFSRRPTSATQSPAMFERTNSSVPATPVSPSVPAATSVQWSTPRRFDRYDSQAIADDDDD